jgi:Na+/phosphate symporter
MAMLKSRSYTNLILTIIAILLVLILARPSTLLITGAQAKDEEQRAKQQAVNVAETSDVAVATREVATANQAIASAIQTLAESVDRVAGAVGSAKAESK